MNHIQTNFSSFFSKIMIGAMFAFFVYSCWSAFEVSKQFFGDSTTSVTIVLVIFVILMLLVASILQYRFTDKQFLGFLIGTSIVVRLSMVLFVDVPITDDMKAMFESAKQVAIGNSVENVTQLPFIIYESIIIRIFGDTVFALQLFNILFCTGTAFFIYRIAAMVFGEECGRIASVFYVLYIPNIFVSSLLTSESLAIFLFYLACYILLYKGLDHPYMWVFSAILFACSNMIFPMGLFLPIFIAVYVLLIEFFQSAMKQKVLLKMIGILILFYSAHFGVSYGIQTMGMSQYTLSNETYVQSVLIGKGKNEGKITKNQSVTEHIDQKVKEIEEERFKLLKPVTNQFSDEGIHSILFKCEKLIYIAVTLFMSIALLHFLIKKQQNEGYMLFLLLISGYVLLRLFQVDMAYYSLIVPALFILQSFGVYMSYVYCQKIFFRK
ncbi:MULTISPECIES: glycosyltransferase family 39 protein [Bacillus]|uniref:glycosyltransferase family 39 protein n=1 Tax=Bacillus TaxID=1386 RepID=UPI000B4BAF89|nr:MULTISPECIES: glycosyltransferase family 39 protein [unclassified Bacillus cereus group]MDA1536172.1 glycosyltransferase family 39 protein [Bacillus cereus group sp. TH254-2LC]MDA1546431.1 glycosyltransferase family 39 protein [Bacillus cereus group sp. TH253LC]MDA1580492.1 glycosyltransferase family 39 protein [Bacillus cereus group sp. TH228LC]MDA1629569.1 glycosyltransferase family 39 protein [Bacillus cereus group sp. TH172LC]MDA1839074.1 glycosyltransferase family 39 protein [Bacillus 